MTNKTVTFCKNISDKDFIYKIFQDGGFVTNAHSFLQNGKRQEQGNIDYEPEDKAIIVDNDL